MNSTNPYPIFLFLGGRRCTVAGIGAVGCRKLRGLIEAGAASIVALDIKAQSDLSVEAQFLLTDQAVIFERRSFIPEDARNSFLVFAATSNGAENRRIARCCEQERTLCDCISEPDAGSFILPATARQGALCAALSTAGQSPYLAHQWRLELEDWLKPREKLAWLMGRLRAPVLALGHEQGQNSTIFRRIAGSPIPHWLERGDIARCRSWLESELPQELRPELELIFSEYADAFA